MSFNASTHPSDGVRSSSGTRTCGVGISSEGSSTASASGAARSRTKLRGPLFSLLAYLAPSAAFASGPLGENGAALTTSNYSVDLYQTALWAGSKVTSLGGSYVALAYDVDGMLQTAAAPAVRPFFSISDFDYWLGFGMTFPSSLTGSDFFNSGRTTFSQNADPRAFYYVTPALILQFGNFGVGVNMELQSYKLGATEDAAQDLSVQFNQTHIQAAYSFLRGALVTGFGLRVLSMDARIGGILSGDYPLSASGIGAETGVLWKPHGYYFSFGAAFRTSISAISQFSDSTVVTSSSDIVLSSSNGQFYLPQAAKLPWDLHLGFVYNFAESLPNAPHYSQGSVAKSRLLRLELERSLIEDERSEKLKGARTEEEEDCINEAYDARVAAKNAEMERVLRDAYWEIQTEFSKRSRRTAMVTASLLIAGATENAVGVESLILQEVNRSGGWVTVSPRVGSEVELFPDLIRLRSGAYLEPTRFETSSARAHYTFGGDIAVGVWNVFGLWPDDYKWRLGLGADIARDFQTFGFTFAGWYPRHKDPIQVPSSLVTKR